MSIFHQTLWQNVYVWKRSTLEPFPLHFHGYVEVLYLKRGRALCSVDFKEYTMKAGDILFVFPDMVHDVVSADANSENYVLFLPREISVFGEFFKNKVPQQPLIPGGADNEVDMLFENALKVYNDRENMYFRGEALGYILLILARLLPRLDLLDDTKTDKSLERRIIEYCSEHFADPIKLSDIACEMGYTPAYFSDIFSKKFRGGFAKFLNALRVEEAKKQLSEDKSVSDVAFSCGFGSIRTFNRVFKEHTGKTPKEYREK
ncbi:MAG: helix-turn-helix transcriptional regulator [Clostridia bacterium]|nr:helix-turn-helix transcriptional regulator [Clostridia bacterium]